VNGGISNLQRVKILDLIGFSIGVGQIVTVGIF